MNFLDTEFATAMNTAILLDIGYGDKETELTYFLKLVFYVFQNVENKVNMF